MAVDVRHEGYETGGWKLDAFEWSPGTGVGTFRYERTVDGRQEFATVERAQPSSPAHRGWVTRN